jgi:hypothetical protein
MGRKTLFLNELDDNTFKEAYSCKPQGTVGDIINRRGLNYIYYNQRDFAPVELMRQVHDEIGLQIPMTSSWMDHAIMLRKIKKNLEIKLTTAYGRDFVIPAGLCIGKCFNKEIGIEYDKIPETNEEFAVTLRDNWDKLHES